MQKYEKFGTRTNSIQLLSFKNSNIAPNHANRIFNDNELSPRYTSFTNVYFPVIACYRTIKVAVSSVVFLSPIISPAEEILLLYGLTKPVKP